MILTRTYQARILVGNWILIVALLASVLYFFWLTNGLLIALSLVILMVVIERTIHTEYRLSSQSLLIHRGRLSADLIIPMTDILRVERIRRFRIGRRAWLTYLVIVYENEKTVAIMPRHEDDFISQLMTIKQTNAQ